ncbi:TPA: hypothetical protein QDZ66_001801 [Pluralibacter gergoviae]|uniref:Uncharacterized protein YobH n=1 Tax=Pluralibacter gergoviae TaxID=61647 RepID=A0A0J5LAA1_PLUGE|nr:YobH family protein [Pluralibacter gergoviae]EKT9638534.1 hypothetical protein [Pluralibacter gergoviae]EKV3542416.1 hypothetical protein [Pluralibacter gergoviae]EKV9898960.1 hypothetical protein [Pluralibacter gergoviae]EKV9931160.1 hypothetical protein [Pluralibacter gergoviae]EKW9976286.1 hypothetical protein [Pluralibacter gergoviae]
MHFLLRTLIVLAIAWLALLLSGYGVLFASHQNAAGLGLQCKYLAARGTSTAQYVHSDSGIIGTSSCPLLRKVQTVVDD